MLESLPQGDFYKYPQNNNNNNDNPLLITYQRDTYICSKSRYNPGAPFHRLVKLSSGKMSRLLDMAYFILDNNGGHLVPVLQRIASTKGNKCTHRKVSQFCEISLLPPLSIWVNSY